MSKDDVGGTGFCWDDQYLARPDWEGSISSPKSPKSP